MKHEKRNENTSRKEQDMLGMRRPRWDRRVTRSLGDDFFCGHCAHEDHDEMVTRKHSRWN